MINLNRCMLLHLYKYSIDKNHFHEFNGKVFYDNANKRFLSASPRLPISSGRGHGDFYN